MSRFVKMFKPEFAEAVREGKKCRTVRPIPNRMPAEGDTIDCRKWSGKAYRSKHEKLCEGTILQVCLIYIDNHGLCFGEDDLPMCPSAAEAFAKGDGFDDLEKMIDWFRETHGLPFRGIVIQWEPQDDQ